MGSRNKKAKMRVDGRNAHETNRFARLPHSLLYSPAYRSLSPNARSLLVELVSMDNDKNNGKLWLSEMDAARRMGVSCPKVARKSFVELTEAGFLAITKDRHWHIKTGTGRARSWRLTWRFNHAEKKPASNEWKDYQHASHAAWKRMDNGLRALSAYRKELSQNRIWQGDPPDTSLKTDVSGDDEQGDMPDTLAQSHEFGPIISQYEQGNSPQYTAVPWDRGFRKRSWQPKSGSGTCPTAAELWSAQNLVMMEGAVS